MGFLNWMRGLFGRKVFDGAKPRILSKEQMAAIDRLNMEAPLPSYFRGAGFGFAVRRGKPTRCELFGRHKGRKKRIHG